MKQLMLLLLQEEIRCEVSFCPSFSAGAKPRWDGRDSSFGSPESRPARRLIPRDRCGCRARLLALGGFRPPEVYSSLSQPQLRIERLPHSAVEMASGRGEQLLMFATRAGWFVSSRAVRLVSYRLRELRKRSERITWLDGRDDTEFQLGLQPVRQARTLRLTSRLPKFVGASLNSHAGKLVHQVISTSA